MLFVAGLKGKPATWEFSGGFRHWHSDTCLPWTPLRSVVKEAGFKMTDIVSVNVYLSDINLIDKMNDVYKKMMPDPKPVRTTVEVGHIRNGGSIEVSCIAIKQ